MLMVYLPGCSLPSKRVDKHLYAFLTLRCAVCALKKRFYPCFSKPIFLSIQLVAYDSWSYVRGYGMRVVNGYISVTGVFGPEYVVKGD